MKFNGRAWVFLGLIVASAALLQVGFVNCSGFSPQEIQRIQSQSSNSQGNDSTNGQNGNQGNGTTNPLPGASATPSTSGTPRPGGGSPGSGATPTPSPTATPTPPPAASKPAIRYVGRFDQSNPTAPRFAWSGSTIEAAFTGTSLKMKMKSSTEIYFTVIIDQSAPTIVRTIPSTLEYTLASNLFAGSHTVKIVRNTEALQGVSEFQGFDFGAGGALAVLPTQNRLRMEVIGDSITCGYGNTGVGPNCPFTPATENNYLAYGSVAARLINADVTTISISGRGVYHNYAGVPNDPNSPTMPFYYPYTLPPVSNPGAGNFLYDFSKQAPMDVVVINLGTNDLSVNPPDAATLSRAYKDFVVQVRAKNPNAHIFCAIGTMISGGSLDIWRQAVQGAISSLQQSGDSKLHFVEFPAQDGARGIGCDYHPSAAQHDYMGNILANSIRQALKL